MGNSISAELEGRDVETLILELAAGRANGLSSDGPYLLSIVNAGDSVKGGMAKLDADRWPLYGMMHMRF